MTPTLFRRPGASPGRFHTPDASRPTRPAGRARRHGGAGFSLVEILVVVGIIAVLATIASVAFVRLDPSGKSTKVTLDSCKAMLAELNSADGLTRQPPAVWWDGNRIAKPASYPRSPGNFGDFWRDPYRDNSNSASPAPASPMPVPPPFTEGSAFLDADIVKNTNLAMYVLMTIPANNAAVAKLPPRATQKWTTDDPESTAIDERAYPLPLDAWGNPIVFVPASGLTNLTTSGVSYAPGAVAPNLPALRAPDGRPFFASAGPDNDLAKGDDNLYSFQD